MSLHWNLEWVVLVPALSLSAALAMLAARQWSSASRRWRSRWVIYFVVSLLAVGVATRPSASREVQVAVPTDVDLVVLLDRTASMGALDASGGRSRMEAAGADLAATIAGAAGATTSVVVFDDVARVAVPFTTDAAAVTSFVQTVGWRPSGKATGSDIAVAVPLAKQLLERADQERPQNRRYLIYVGDGEQTQAEAPGSFVELAPLLDGAQVWGYGTEKGGPMPIAPGASELVQRNGVRQLSVSDPRALRRIAQDLEGEFLQRNGDGATWAELASGAARVREQMRPAREYYWMFAVGAAAGLSVLVALAARRVREVVEEQ